jgi:Permuted papain-like amidase enzyme, YaeF/YiiX, C92 family
MELGFRRLDEGRTSMLRIFGWVLMLALNGNAGKEPTDLLVPPTWKGNPWGPAATSARETGELPTVEMTPLMTQWDRWGRTVLREGDIVFRRGNAKLLRGHFPFSRFIANASASPYSHTGIVAIEDDGPVVYDTTKAGPRRQPFAVWVLDNVGAFGVKRLRTEHNAHIPQVIRYCRDVYERQVPFDNKLAIDDQALYCVEMTEKAFRSSGLTLSEPILLGNMERAPEFPICMFAFCHLTPLKLDQPVFFPGNERTGIWSSPLLETVYQPRPTAKAASR